jgi:2-polyprenyl-3-methyl-5-hydroxy-6-metoxy-1,4-benzoquinol methylase
MKLKAEDQSDPAGLETLEEFADAPTFNKWLFDNLAPYCKGRILEIGSGIGNISRFLLEQPGPVTLTDLRPEYCSRLREKYADCRNLSAVRRLDVSVTDFEATYPGLVDCFDTVLASNVVEHIGNDTQAVTNCRKMLTREGHLVILVPAYQWLYNGLDEALGHFRRYNAKSLKALLQSQGMEIIASRYFNFVAMAGWWFSGSVLKRRVVPSGQLKIYNRLVPVFKLVDRITFHSSGLSVIAVAKTT